MLAVSILCIVACVQGQQTGEQALAIELDEYVHYGELLLTPQFVKMPKTAAVVSILEM